MAGSGPGGGGNCPVFGKSGHQYIQQADGSLKCACGAKPFQGRAT